MSTPKVGKRRSKAAVASSKGSRVRTGTSTSTSRRRPPRRGPSSRERASCVFVAVFSSTQVPGGKNKTHTLLSFTTSPYQQPPLSTPAAATVGPTNCTSWPPSCLPSPPATPAQRPCQLHPTSTSSCHITHNTFTVQLTTPTMTTPNNPYHTTSHTPIYSTTTIPTQ